MNRKILLFIFILIVSACTSPQVTEETDCCLPVDFTMSVPTETQTPASIYPVKDDIATAIAFETKIAEYPSICNISGTRIFSPDGLWREEFCETGIENKQVLTVSNRETKTIWKMFYLDYVLHSEFMTEGSMAIQHWSKDGKYAFFNSYSTGSGGGCFRRGGTEEAWGVFRLDLQTGQVNEILPIVVNNYYGFSFSPTGRRLIYEILSDNLQILDITTGEEITVANKKDLTFRGGYIWSQDGLRFIYSTVKYSPDYSTEDYTIRLVDAKTGTEQIILETSQDCLSVTEWADTNIIKIQKIQEDYDESLIEFDLNTNTILSETPITP